MCRFLSGWIYYGLLKTILDELYRKLEGYSNKKSEKNIEKALKI